MASNRNIRIIKALREFNIPLNVAVDFFLANNIAIDNNPNAKISEKEYQILREHFEINNGHKPSVILELENLLNRTLLSKSDLLSQDDYPDEFKNYFHVNQEDDIIELNIEITPSIYDSLYLDEVFSKQDEFFKILRNLVKLEALFLIGSNLGDYSSLENLTEIEMLDLTGNMIDDISFIKGMTKLKFLNLSNNQISDTSPLENLENLFHLNLGVNQIENTSFLKKLTLLRNLNLSSNIIDNIDGLKGFKELENLFLYDNVITEISAISSLKVDQNLLLGNNQIFDFSPLYNSLRKKHIGFLDVYGNPSSYPPLKNIKMSQLDILSWFENNLEVARDKIRNIQNNRLDLGNLGLTDLSFLPELFQLENLEELILSNHYAEFDNGFWNKIYSANEHYPNNILGIPNDIKKLKRLRKLIIGGDWKKGNDWNRWRIKSVNNILDLRFLEVLNVSNNQIVNFKNLYKLSNLKSLYANNNEIKNINDLGKFESLQELYLSNNQLKKVDFLKDLDSIKAIDLHANLITDLTSISGLIKKIGIIDDKWKVDTICISNNKLVNPGIEVVRNGVTAVLNQIEENNLSKLFINDEIKLILIGNSEAGKSTFASYLNGNRDFAKKLPYTLWMDELNVIIEDTKVRVFDFGGHDYFHDTHHIFFTNNTIYFLLWDNLNNDYKSRKIEQVDKNNLVVINETEDYPLKYWLESIKHYIRNKNATNFNFGEDFEKTQTYSSDVLVIQNKVSENKEIKHLNNELLKENYSFIYDFGNIDIHTNRNMEYITLMLKEMIVNSKFVGVKYPVYYKKIRESLQSYNDNGHKPVVTIEEFLDYCIKISKEDLTLDFTRNIANYLDAIGVIILSKNEDLLYLNKNLLSEGVLKIFLGLKDKKGEFNKNYAEELLGDHTEHILKFMIDFKMIFRIEKTNLTFYVAPLYLPSTPNALIDLLIDDNKLPSRRFHYTGFIHKNVVLDIFSKYSDKIKRDDDYKNTYYWKSGLIIKENNGLILIKFFNGTNNGGAFIDIIKLNNQVDEVFFQTVIQYIIDVNKDYKPSEMVTSNGLDFVPLKDILENEKQKNIIFKYENKYYRLIDFKPYLKNKNYMKKLFISYSNEDHHWKEMLVKNLKPLTQFQLLKPWSCEDMTSGNWNDQIQKELKEADIVVFMMSLNFVTSDYILREEVFKTFEEIKNNPDKKVICVLVKNFAWQSFSTFRKLTNLSDEDFEKLQDANTLTELTSKQFIPYCIDNQGELNERRYLKPLNKWQFEEDAFIEVIRNITSNL